jgi:hypothetical protein
MVCCAAPCGVLRARRARAGRAGRSRRDALGSRRSAASPLTCVAGPTYIAVISDVANRVPTCTSCVKKAKLGNVKAGYIHATKGGTGAVSLGQGKTPAVGRLSDGGRAVPVKEVPGLPGASSPDLTQDDRQGLTDETLDYGAK